MPYDPGALLTALCQAVITDPALDPAGGCTFCNIGARRIAQGMGCRDFDNLDFDADDLYNVMLKSKKWTSATGSDATIHALSGGLAFASMTSQMLGESHGHIACIYPIGQGFSPSLNKDVPFVANCGTHNGEMKVSEAFPISRGEPKYFCWSGE